jgi:hypothetical protein
MASSGSSDGYPYPLPDRERLAMSDALTYLALLAAYVTAIAIPLFGATTALLMLVGAFPGRYRRPRSSQISNGEVEAIVIRNVLDRSAQLSKTASRLLLIDSTGQPDVRVEAQTELVAYPGSSERTKALLHTQELRAN